MKIFIVCDIEGVAGVADFMKQCMEEGAYYQQAIRMATRARMDYCPELKT